MQVHLAPVRVAMSKKMMDRYLAVNVTNTTIMHALVAHSVQHILCAGGAHLLDIQKDTLHRPSHCPLRHSLRSSSQVFTFYWGQKLNSIQLPTLLQAYGM